ncbi:MAG: MoaD/ThiS family protein [Candidatus Heimdallarchaeota archaeon]|nr:MoaD/ThiS family protein [Candidatus Heimdallarchaeota archaeon]
MEIKVKLFANLRERVTPKPPIGEPIVVELNNGSTIADLLVKLDFPDEDVAIIFINSVHQERSHQLTDGTIVSMFPPSGGG